jgi:23S rRNA (pseudouridine1915-N3)-methyltransferase
LRIATAFRFSAKREASSVKVLLYYIGKARDAHANAMAEEYIKRTTRFAKCEMREIHPLRFDPWAKHPTASKILLDPAGRPLDSAGFISLVEKAERDGRDMVFLIGGAEGLPAEWKPRADLLLGLSPMTMPHELARVVLAEQIYRGFTALRGHPYPR